MASYAKGIDLYTIDELGRAGAARGRRDVQEVPADPRAPEGDRRRRRQGPAHPRRLAPHREERRRASRSQQAAAEAPALDARGAERGEGDGRRRQQERPHRAQHRADAPQRDPAPRQRQVVRLARRPRLLAADARAEAARGLGDAGGARRRDRARRRRPAARQEAAVAQDRPRDPEADGGRRGALRRRGRPRLGLDVRVHRRPRPLLLHGGQHPHPGGAPGHRALLRRSSSRTRTTRTTPSSSSRSSRRWRSSRATRRGCRSRSASRASRPSVEARLNATDASLSPHAGGLIRYWSKPIEGEIRDDQGISMPNPDTGMFMRYRVAGAYDSNIALLLTKGADRLESYVHLSKVLGQDEPARREPRDEPRVPLRARQLVPRPERDGEADHPLRRPVPHARRPAEGGGEQARHGLRLPGDEEALRRADGGGGARRPVGREGDGRGASTGSSRCSPARWTGCSTTRTCSPGWLSLNRKQLQARERQDGLDPQPARRAQRHVRVPEHAVGPEGARRRGHLAARPRAAPARDPLLPGAPQDLRPAQGGVLQARTRS